ncbi:esterase [Nocardia sp. NPDC051030]|uniref:LGFP repeat-containing protein n=1 Tax=Nocardia sp. NPDC051030 TaxID=3155162 RepID=UPI003432F9E9
MHHFARRTAGIIAAVAVVTLFAAGCDKDKDKDAKSETGMTTSAEMTNGGASETKIATRDGSEVTISGDFLTKYTELGGETGPMGTPSGPEKEAPGGGMEQEFAGGAIYSSPATGTHVVWGEIRKAWEADGGPDGKLGYPTTDEVTMTDGGQKSEFTGGSITFVDGKTTVTPK